MVGTRPGREVASDLDRIRHNYGRSAQVTAEPDVEQAHGASPDHPEAAARLHIESVERAHATGQWLDKDAGLVGDCIGQRQYIDPYDLCRHPHELAESAGIQRRFPEAGARRIQSAQATSAQHAGNVVVEEDAIAHLKVLNFGCHRLDHAHRLVAQYGRSLPFQVPIHGVTGADSANRYANQNIARPQLRYRHVLQPHIVDRVGACRPHHRRSLRAHGTIATLTASRRRSSAKAAGSSSSVISFVIRGSSIRVRLQTRSQARRTESGV